MASMTVSAARDTAPEHPLLGHKSAVGEDEGESSVGVASGATKAPQTPGRGSMTTTSVPLLGGPP